MNKTFSVEDILWAFIEHADDARRAITVSMAGKPWGYVRIKGPSGDHQVISERYNATVCVAEIHRGLPGVDARPNPSVPIEQHALGHSSGPKLAPFLWGISAKQVRANYTSPSDFVAAIVKTCATAGTPW